YELLGFTYGAMDSILKAVDAFKQVVLIDPERQLDPNRVSPKAYSAFDVALRQVLLVRQLRVDSVSFVGGQGAVPIRFTVTQPARVVARAIGTGATVVIDSGAWNGQVNLRWPARLPGGDPVPAGAYTVVVDARLGQNTFSASQPIRVGHGRVDTLPSITSLPGYQFLPETEIPPQSWRPVGLAFLYTGGALVGTLGLEGSSLGSSSKRELGLVGGAALVLALALRPATGQLVTVGPQFVLADYREVASGLRYRGSGVGGAVWARRDRLSAEAAVVRVSFDPAAGSAADSGFTATQVDA